MKKQKAPIRKFKCNWSAIKWVAVGFALITLISAQIVYDKEVWRQLGHTNDQELSNLIISSIQNLRKDAVVDGPTRQVYLPEARLVLPPYPSDVGYLKYTYEQGGSDQSEDEVQITTNEVLGFGITGIRQAENVNEIFTAVPQAQACSRQIVLVYKDASSQLDPSYTKAGSKQLANGRTLYMYLEPKCKVNPERLINYLQQIQSY